MNIILFGFKKCGKTYYGLKAAQKLHMHFVDSDLLLEEHYRKIHHEEIHYREIAKKHGFPFFRALEKHVVSSLMQQKNSIISLGGGVVLDPENVERLRQIGTLVYIKTPKKILEQRILSSDPPAYMDSLHPLESFEKMYMERLPVYEEVKALEIDTEGLSENEIIDIICDLIKKMHGKHDGKQ